MYLTLQECSAMRKGASKKLGCVGDAQGRAGALKEDILVSPSLAEASMYRFKQLLAGKISLRNYNGQVGEVMAYVSAINKLNTLGLPVRKPRV